MTMDSLKAESPWIFISSCLGLPLCLAQCSKGYCAGLLNLHYEPFMEYLIALSSQIQELGKESDGKAVFSSSGWAK